jgi:hypothetical protein
MDVRSFVDDVDGCEIRSACGLRIQTQKRPDQSSRRTNYKYYKTELVNI